MDIENERQNRLDALKRNLEWLQEHDLDEHNAEAAKRLGLIKGDAVALSREIAESQT